MKAQISPNRNFMAIMRREFHTIEATKTFLKINKNFLISHRDDGRRSSWIPENNFSAFYTFFFISSYLCRRRSGTKMRKCPWTFEPCETCSVKEKCVEEGNKNHPTKNVCSSSVEREKAEKIDWVFLLLVKCGGCRHRHRSLRTHVSCFRRRVVFSGAGGELGDDSITSEVVIHPCLESVSVKNLLNFIADLVLFSALCTREN